MIDAMRTVPFCIATDGGNDRAMELTLYPILVTYFDKSASQVQTSVLSVPSLNKDSTGHNIAGLLIEEFLNFEIPWKNCIGITTDNANVMIGTTNGVMGYLSEQQPELINIGCPCHLVNLTAEKSAKTLSVLKIY